MIAFMTYNQVYLAMTSFEWWHVSRMFSIFQVWTTSGRRGCGSTSPETWWPSPTGRAAAPGWSACCTRRTAWWSRSATNGGTSTAINTGPSLSVNSASRDTPGNRPRNGRGRVLPGAMFVEIGKSTLEHSFSDRDARAVWTRNTGITLEIGLAQSCIVGGKVTVHATVWTGLQHIYLYIMCTCTHVKAADMHNSF